MSKSMIEGSEAAVTDGTLAKMVTADWNILRENHHAQLAFTCFNKRCKEQHNIAVTFDCGTFKIEWIQTSITNANKNVFQDYIQKWKPNHRTSNSLKK